MPNVKINCRIFILKSKRQIVQKAEMLGTQKLPLEATARDKFYCLDKPYPMTPLDLNLDLWLGPIKLFLKLRDKPRKIQKIILRNHSDSSENQKTEHKWPYF